MQGQINCLANKFVEKQVVFDLLDKVSLMEKQINSLVDIPVWISELIASAVAGRNDVKLQKLVFNKGGLQQAATVDNEGNSR